MNRISKEIVIGNAIIELNKKNILVNEIYDYEKNFINNKEGFNQRIEKNDIIQFCNVYSYFVSYEKKYEIINVDLDKINTMKNVFRSELKCDEVNLEEKSVKKHVKIIRPFIMSRVNKN